MKRRVDCAQSSFENRVNKHLDWKGRKGNWLSCVPTEPTIYQTFFSSFHHCFLEKILRKIYLLSSNVSLVFSLAVWRRRVSIASPPVLKTEAKGNRNSGDLRNFENKIASAASYSSKISRFFSLLWVDENAASTLEKSFTSGRRSANATRDYQQGQLILRHSAFFRFHDQNTRSPLCH